MTEETFKKILKILPLVIDKFFIACNCEPTIHPDFIGLLSRLPPKYAAKTIFTTNLAKPLPAAFFTKLSGLKLNYFNISLDSFNPSVFEEFRKGSKFQNFMDNLEKMRTEFLKAKNPPKVRYITMIFKQNIDEAEEILNTCMTRFLSSENEFRRSMDQNDWIKARTVSETEWLNLAKRLERSSYRHMMVDCDDLIFERKWYLPRSMYIKTGGMITFRGLEVGHLHRVADPYQFLRQLDHTKETYSA